jgi:hypothetical protein
MCPEHAQREIEPWDRLCKWMATYGLPRSVTRIGKDGKPEAAWQLVNTRPRSGRKTHGPFWDVESCSTALREYRRIVQFIDEPKAPTKTDAHLAKAERIAEALSGQAVQRWRSWETNSPAE